MRRYQGYVVDSARWERFAFRSDDIVISTPARCGTTWMQKVVGMLVFDRVEVGASLSTISPWLDMLIYTDEEIFRLLEEQSHRRFIKTHTPLDGIPRIPSVTYITVIRHPLDAALSYRDHRQNLRMERLEALRTEVAGPDYRWQSAFDDEPEEPDAHLRWFIDNAIEPTGSGPYGLADYCNQIRTYWDARAERNVHLFHYMDLWSDRDLEMRKVAKLLGVEVDEKRWPNFVEAAGLDSMRSRPEEIFRTPNPSSGSHPSDSFGPGAPETGGRSSTAAASLASTSGCALWLVTRRIGWCEGARRSPGVRPRFREHRRHDAPVAWSVRAPALAPVPDDDVGPSTGLTHGPPRPGSPARDRARRRSRACPAR